MHLSLFRRKTLAVNLIYFVKKKRRNFSNSRYGVWSKAHKRCTRALHCCSFSTTSCLLSCNLRIALLSFCHRSAIKRKKIRKSNSLKQKILLFFEKSTISALKEECDKSQCKKKLSYLLKRLMQQNTSIKWRKKKKELSSVQTYIVHFLCMPRDNKWLGIASLLTRSFAA